jgi:hypothetical protein
MPSPRCCFALHLQPETLCVRALLCGPPRSTSWTKEGGKRWCRQPTCGPLHAVHGRAKTKCHWFFQHGIDLSHFTWDAQPRGFSPRSPRRCQHSNTTAATVRRCVWLQHSVRFRMIYKTCTLKVQLLILHSSSIWAAKTAPSCTF